MSTFPHDFRKGDISCDVTLVDSLSTSSDYANYYLFTVLDNSFDNPNQWVSFDTCNGNTQFDCSLDLYGYNASTDQWFLSDSNKEYITSTDTHGLHCVKAQFQGPFWMGRFFIEVDETPSSPVNDYTFRMLCSQTAGIKTAQNYTAFVGSTKEPNHNSIHAEEEILFMVIYIMCGVIALCILFLLGNYFYQKRKRRPRIEFREAINQASGDQTPPMTKDSEMQMATFDDLYTPAGDDGGGGGSGDQHQNERINIITTPNHNHNGVEEEEEPEPEQEEDHSMIDDDNASNKSSKTEEDTAGTAASLQSSASYVFVSAAAGSGTATATATTSASTTAATSVGANNSSSNNGRAMLQRNQDSNNSNGDPHGDSDTLLR